LRVHAPFIPERSAAKKYAAARATPAANRWRARRARAADFARRAEDVVTSSWDDAGSDTRQRLGVRATRLRPLDSAETTRRSLQLCSLVVLSPTCRARSAAPL